MRRRKPASTLRDGGTQRRLRHKITVPGGGGEIADRDEDERRGSGAGAEVEVSGNGLLSFPTFRSVHFRAARSVTFELTPDNLDSRRTEQCPSGDFVS